MKTVKPTEENIIKFLDESNKIEGVTDRAALDDALEAWKFLIAQDKLTLSNIKYTHALLLRFIAPEIAGMFREVNVRVGLQTCPDWREVPKLMKVWLAVHGDAKTEEEIKLAHIALNRVHGFQDGNGRVSRIIMNRQRVKNNLPLLIIKADWPKEMGDQKTYYSWWSK